MRKTFTLVMLVSACSRKGGEGSSSADSAVTDSVLRAVASSNTSAPTAASAVSHTQISPRIRLTCTEICDRSRQLKCKSAGECDSNCLGMASLTPCGDAIGAFYQCLLHQPLDRWECSEDGVASIREGLCDADQERALGCMEAKMAPLNH